ncbi:hypothetical protein [Lacinutrix sp. Hel_I_90]|uniref:hypothetical protein n=1 Tax=Lacinutrix sp. Hel_I_90 TaxID=1249999 RepID=UPI0005CAA634|nr:hypothetical protein [Lacinutrix sp. Hel_I_90]
MATPKQQVEQYLKHDRSLMGGRNLYNKLPNKSLAVQNTLSRLTNNPKNIQIVCYELAKLAGIKERMLTILTQKPVVASTAKQKPEKEEAKPLSPEDKLLAFNPENVDYKAAKALVKALGLKPKNKKQDTIVKALVNSRATLVSKKLVELPQEVKASIKLRDQFPFLRETDCPNVLKLLVNDLITTYETFKTNQPKLHELLSDEAAQVLVDTVKDNYIENKQAYAELEHYKKNKAVLGEHPMFERIALKEEVTKMSTPDLTKKIHSLTTNINRNSSKGNEPLVARDEDLKAHAEAELAKR